MAKKDKKQIESDYKNFIVEPLDISFGKLILLDNTKLSIQYGQHYGLVGKNGIGKTTLLNWITEKKITIPKDLDMIYVKQEEPESENTVLDTVLSSNEKLYKQNNRVEELEELVSDPDVDQIIFDEYKQLADQLGQEYSKARALAKKILCGLGFSLEQQNYPVSHFSGGYRMRISLTRSLFMTPSLLILDEPTNHLDLHANIWLTEYLKTYPKTILLVSHDKFFVDEVCTTIIHMDNKKLTYYTGNYEQFQKQLVQNKAKHLKDWDLYKKKVDSMKKSGKKPVEIEAFVKKSNISKPEKEYVVNINFLQPNTVKGCLVQLENISFGYDKENILNGVTIDISLGSRIAIVGKNGVGKSTLLKLIMNEIQPTSGQINKHSSLRIGYYNQHFEESLPFDINGVQYLMELNTELDITNAHKYLSLFGLEPTNHLTKIGLLSGGQKARVKLASFGITKPHLLLLDEPTNHLDMVAIDSLIIALKNFTGAVILVTHNFDLIQELDSELWEIDDGKLYKYSGTYDDYIQEIYEEYD